MNCNFPRNVKVCRKRLYTEKYHIAELKHNLMMTTSRFLSLLAVNYIHTYIQRDKTKY